jgi:hypothetical protein
VFGARGSIYLQREHPQSTLQLDGDILKAAMRARRRPLGGGNGGTGRLSRQRQRDRRGEVVEPQLVSGDEQLGA